MMYNPEVYGYLIIYFSYVDAPVKSPYNNLNLPRDSYAYVPKAQLYQQYTFKM